MGGVYSANPDFDPLCTAFCDWISDWRGFEVHEMRDDIPLIPVTVEIVALRRLSDIKDEPVLEETRATYSKRQISRLAGLQVVDENNDVLRVLIAV